MYLPAPHAGITGRALFCAIALVAACQEGCGHPASWRTEQETLITQAIVRDLIAMPGDEGATRPTGFCVYGRSDATGYHDPEPRLVSLLREEGTNAYPVSQCNGWTVIATGAKAYIVGVESLEWKDDAFVKAEGEQLRGILSGGTWLYTLSRGAGGWSVDTVRGNKIY
jgi:hypothetical protein